MIDTQDAHSERGSALITALAICVILSTLLMILLGAVNRQQQFAMRNGHRQQARYIAESALLRALLELNRPSSSLLSQTPKPRRMPVAGHDSADVHLRPWGAFLSLCITASVRKQSSVLQTLIGHQPSPVFQRALMLSPDSPPLVISGDARIHGDVAVGRAGVRKGAPGDPSYSGRRLVYGDILSQGGDQRPEIDENRLAAIYRRFRRLAATEASIDFFSLTIDSSRHVDLSPYGLDQPVRVTAAQLNARPWRIRGPGTLVCDMPAVLTANLNIGGLVEIICLDKVILSGGFWKDVIIYSPREIILTGNGIIRAQLFSEGHISLQGDARLAYPSLAVVYSATDTASLAILDNAQLSGWALLLDHRELLPPDHRRPKLIIGGGARLNGLAYSDNLVTFSGVVHGMVVAERLYFYHAPAHYFNRMCDGQIHRHRLSSDFRLPLLFSREASHLSAVSIHE